MFGNLSNSFATQGAFHALAVKHEHDWSEHVGVDLLEDPEPKHMNASEVIPFLNHMSVNATASL